MRDFQSMNILNIHKFYYQRRGAERYYFDLTKLLVEKGHRVIPFSMQDDRNYPSVYSKYFVPNLELGTTNKSAPFSNVRAYCNTPLHGSSTLPSALTLHGMTQSLRTLGRILYYPQARRNIGDLLDAEKIDIAHIHNIYHHISPSILGEIHARGIPIVMTVHDFKLICPNYTLYTEGAICERCKGGKYYNATIHKCLKNSTAQSLAGTVELYFHKTFRFYEKYVSRFIAPSQFVKNKLVEFGQNPDQIEVIPHFVDVPTLEVTSHKSQVTSETAKYLLYGGALSPEKGIFQFIRYFHHASIPDLELWVAGDGPEKSEIEGYLQENKIKNIILLGKLEKSVLLETMAASLGVVIPSVVYETFGLAALEAFSQKKIVLSSSLGGLGELVEDGKTGFLFDMNDQQSVIRSLLQLSHEKDRVASMGEYAFQVARDRYNKELHYQRLMELYGGVLKGKKA
ncbi:MAG: Glycosyltransferase [Parcubacteria group bacterium Gr01-1014_18]|nr:MAG: Glycosyltransferase [Parcubacteria group bacterium Greene0416_36]TSC80023.1 MAG: Glycosyltransferase [Parcubacteria group bacterium Gr01-1014_18]TSC98109.1 MAG: Glycosyltransferase [Parcubacteria group bacterium Greene1014_20]TSD06625.1 MAG: Glycosyltransferase [Parcubacteria group bacterium Greene0714_2]